MSSSIDKVFCITVPVPTLFLAAQSRFFLGAGGGVVCDFCSSWSFPPFFGGSIS